MHVAVKVGVAVQVGVAVAWTVIFSHSSRYLGASTSHVWHTSH